MSEPRYFACEVCFQRIDALHEELLVVVAGSMSGSKIEKTKESLLLFLKSLPKKCRFQIVGFGSTFHPLFPQYVIGVG